MSTTSYHGLSSSYGAFPVQIEGLYIDPSLQLLGASCLTILALFVTSALYFFRTLPPAYNSITNAALSVLWVLGLSFLTWNVGWTFGHCAISTWMTHAGIMVCRLFKACTAFTVTALCVPNHSSFRLAFVNQETPRLASLLALSLDIRTYRNSTRLGQYNAMHEPDVKRSIPMISSPTPQYESDNSQRAGFESGDLGDPRPYKVQESIEVDHFGYSAPTEQTRYDPVHRMS
ncbi:MAG: hypothetical protein Q9168_001036 [Polycauliona sp. 1 TL-2023]